MQIGVIAKCAGGKGNRLTGRPAAANKLIGGEGVAETKSQQIESAIINI